MAKITKLPTPKYDEVTESRPIDDNVISSVISALQSSISFIVNPLKSIDENTLETNINLEKTIQLMESGFPQPKTIESQFEKSIDENTLESNINLEKSNSYLKSIDENTLETNINLEQLNKRIDALQSNVNRTESKALEDKSEQKYKSAPSSVTPVQQQMVDMSPENDTGEKKPSLAMRGIKYFGIDTASPLLTDAVKLGKEGFTFAKKKIFGKGKQSDVSIKDNLSKTANYFGLKAASPLATDALSLGKEKLASPIKRMFGGTTQKEENLTTVNKNLKKIIQQNTTEVGIKKESSIKTTNTMLNRLYLNNINENQVRKEHRIETVNDQLIKLTEAVVDLKPKKDLESELEAKSKKDKLPKILETKTSKSESKSGGIFGNMFDGLKDGLGKAFSTILSPKNLIRGLTRLALPAMIIGSLVSGIVDGFKKWKETGSITEALLEGASGIVEFLSFGLISKDDFKKYAGIVYGYVDEYLIQPVKSMMDSVGEMFRPVGDMLSNMWDGAKQMLQKIEIPKVSIFGKEFGPWKVFSDDKPKQESSGSTTSSQPKPNAVPEGTKKEVSGGSDEKMKRDWAYSVHSGKATMDQVPKQFKSDVEALVKKPEANWGPAASSDAKSSGNVAQKPKQSGSAPSNSIKSENTAPVPSSPSTGVAMDNNSTKPSLASSGSGTSPGIKPEKAGEPGIRMPSISGDDKSIMAMIERHEGKRHRPYKDSLGLWTVGVGHLIGDGKTLPPEWNRTFSEEEVQTLFAKDYEHHKEAAMKFPGWKNFNKEGQAAMIDLTFNMGPTWYKKWPTFTKAATEGNSDQAASSLQDSKWYTQVGNRAKTIVSLIKSGFKSSGEKGSSVTSEPAMQSKGMTFSEDGKQKTAEAPSTSSTPVKTESGTLSTGSGGSVVSDTVKPESKGSGLMFGLIKRDNGDLRKSSDPLSDGFKPKSTGDSTEVTPEIRQSVNASPVPAATSMISYEVPKQQAAMTNAVTEMKKQVDDNKNQQSSQTSGGSPVIAPSSSSSSSTSNVTNIFNAPDLDSTVRRLSDMSMFRNKVW